MELLFFCLLISGLYVNFRNKSKIIDRVKITMEYTVVLFIVIYTLVFMAEVLYRYIYPVETWNI